MMNTIEHGGFHRGIVYHVLKDYLIPHLQFVIKLPKTHVIATQAAVAKEKEGKYTFVVDKDANKYQIKQAVEEMFGVNVVSVHTAIFNGKTKRMGMHEGTKSDWKKAIVKLKEGQEITIEEA